MKNPEFNPNASPATKRDVRARVRFEDWWETEGVAFDKKPTREDRYKSLARAAFLAGLDAAIDVNRPNPMPFG